MSENLESTYADAEENFRGWVDAASGLAQDHADYVARLEAALRRIAEIGNSGIHYFGDNRRMASIAENALESRV